MPRPHGKYTERGGHPLAAHTQRPIATGTAVRRVVISLGFLGAALTYLDRVCLSAAAPRISDALGLSDTAMGTVFGVFALSYGLFEIPMGWLGDRFGQRRTLVRIVLAWSVFTAATGAVRSYGTLLTTRF